MLDIVAPNDHELSLPVEGESIDQAESRLPAARHSGNPEPMAEYQTKYKEDDGRRDDDGGENQEYLQGAVVAGPNIT
jgi:hypothetical protein